jgi:hypothetical protein
MTGMSTPRFTRRTAAAALVASPLRMASMPPPQASAAPVQAQVRNMLTQNSEALRKTELSIFTEPSFAFHTY